MPFSCNAACDAPSKISILHFFVPMSFCNRGASSFEGMSKSFVLATTNTGTRAFFNFSPSFSLMYAHASANICKRCFNVSLGIMVANDPNAGNIAVIFSKVSLKFPSSTASVANRMGSMSTGESANGNPAYKFSGI